LGDAQTGAPVLSPTQIFVARAGASFSLTPVRADSPMDHVFKDAAFMSARDKQLTLKAWVRFMRHGLRWEDFTKRLYEHLHLHCSFIAHYDRAGFYATYFNRGEDTLCFLSQFDKEGGCRSVEYGGAWIAGDYADLNRGMVEEASSFIPKLADDARTAQEAADVAQAEELLAKYGRRVL